MGHRKIRNEKHAETLIDLILTFKVKKIAEIGVLGGCTTRSILKYFGTKIDEYWAIDRWRGLDMPAQYCHICGWMTKFSALRVLKLESKTAATLFPLGYLDLVFIDANHRYEAVKKDIEWWFPIVKSGGILCGHNYEIKRPGVIQAVDERFKGDATIMPHTVWVVGKLINNAS